MKLFLSILILSCFIAPDAFAQQYVSATISPKPVVCKAGDSARVAIRLLIRDGWHILSASTSRENAVPTVVKAHPSKEVSFVRIDYPEGVKRKFQFSTDPLEIYEHECVMMMTIATDPQCKGGRYAVPVEIRYQACSTTACVMPASLKIEAVVIVPFSKSSGVQNSRGRKLRWFEDSRLFQ